MPSQNLNVQITPPNILYLLTYLTSVVARRDYTGTNEQCKTLVHARAMKESEDVARAEEMWDIGCRSLSFFDDGVADSISFAYAWVGGCGTASFGGDDDQS